MIAMRDDAFAVLGDAAPAFTVDTVTENPNPYVRRRIEGTFAAAAVPHRTAVPPGGRFVLDAAGLPQRQPGTFTAHFTCNLPPASATSPARMSLYGHGLLGDRGEVNGGLTRKMSANHNIAYCATDWYGMAEEDIGAAVAALTDLSTVPGDSRPPAAGLPRLPVPRAADEAPAGIQRQRRVPLRRPIGPEDATSSTSTATARAPSSAARSPPSRRTSPAPCSAEAGMNYSLLLDRSVDFDEYLNWCSSPTYPRRYDRIIGIAVAQLLWDRGETNGYANHVTRDPLPEHAACTRCCCSAPSATTRSPSTACASRPRRSAPPPMSRIAAAGRVTEAIRVGCSRRSDLPVRRLGVLPVGHRLARLAGRQRAAARGPRSARRHAQHPRGAGAEEISSGIPTAPIEDVCGGAACTAPIPPENAD